MSALRLLRVVVLVLVSGALAEATNAKEPADTNFATIQPVAMLDAPGTGAPSTFILPEQGNLKLTIYRLATWVDSLVLGMEYPEYPSIMSNKSWPVCTKFVQKKLNFLSFHCHVLSPLVAIFI